MYQEASGTKTGMKTSVTLLMLFETHVLNILYFYFVELRGSVDSAYFVEGSSSYSRRSIIYFSVHLWNTQCKEWAIGMYSLSAHIHITGILKHYYTNLFLYHLEGNRIKVYLIGFYFISKNNSSNVIFLP